MNRKEIAEIKRRLNPEFHNVTCIRGCYVNGSGEVISAFTRSLESMAEEEAEQYLGIFRRVLSGVQGQNLLDIEFSPEQVMRSPEHHLLTRLKDSALKDDDAVSALFQAVIPTLHTEDHALILLMHDGYDVPYRSQDGQRVSEMSTEVFHYVLCAVCPVKLTKPILGYQPETNDFRNRPSDWVVSMPEAGFMFPCFEERAADIYKALFYTRDTADSHEELIRALFDFCPPMPAALQKEAFQTVLESSLREECSLEVMQKVHEQVMEKVEERRQDRHAPPLTLDKYDVKEVLAECGVKPARMETFDAMFDSQFGDQAHLTAVNLISPRQFQVKTPSVVIRVHSDRSDLVETRIIDGLPYILIRAEEGVEVNGVSVSI